MPGALCYSVAGLRLLPQLVPRSLRRELMRYGVASVSTQSKFRSASACGAASRFAADRACAPSPSSRVPSASRAQSAAVSRRAFLAASGLPVQREKPSTEATRVNLRRTGTNRCFWSVVSPHPIDGAPRCAASRGRSFWARAHPGSSVCAAPPGVYGGCSSSRTPWGRSAPTVTRRSGTCAGWLVHASSPDQPGGQSVRRARRASSRALAPGGSPGGSAL